MSDVLNILYVEDCQATVELLSLSLERYNFASTLLLDVAETVDEAIEIFTLDKHVAAMIDWNLPDGYGTEVAEHIRSVHQTLPIIFVSSSFTNEHLVATEKYNPKACLEKDFSKDFIEKINHLFRS